MIGFLHKNSKIVLLLFALLCIPLLMLTLGNTPEDPAIPVVQQTKTPGIKHSSTPTPTPQKPRELLIVIDPGHGGDDLGTYNGSFFEKDANLDISLKLGNALKKENIKIVYTREKDVFVDLDPRSKMANDLGADMFISIHNNAHDEDPNYRGTETLYYDTGDSSGFNSKKLAMAIQKELVKTLNTYDIGIIHRPGLSVLRKTKMPAVIAEIAYISNASDRAKLQSPDFRQQSADAIARAVMGLLDDMGAIKDKDGKWMIQPKEAS